MQVDEIIQFGEHDWRVLAIQANTAMKNSPVNTSATAARYYTIREKTKDTGMNART